MSRQKKKQSDLILFKFLLISLTLLTTTNFTVQIYRKPSEILNFLPLGKAKTLEQTWSAYQKYFRRYSVDFITPIYLASLAHVESSGNPLATPKWRMRLHDDWSKLYAPESTAVGLFQFTNATYEEAKKYCVRSGRIIRDGRWDDFNSCWFNWAYLRISAADSIQMAAALLYTDTLDVLQSLAPKISAQRKREVSSVIHLCGKTKGIEFVQKKFNLRALRNCGDYSPLTYVQKVSQNERALESFDTNALR